VWINLERRLITANEDYAVITPWGSVWGGVSCIHQQYAHGLQGEPCFAGVPLKHLPRGILSSDEMLELYTTPGHL